MPRKHNPRTLFIPALQTGKPEAEDTSQEEVPKTQKAPFPRQKNSYAVDGLALRELEGEGLGCESLNPPRHTSYSGAKSASCFQNKIDHTL